MRRYSTHSNSCPIRQRISACDTSTNRQCILTGEAFATGGVDVWATFDNDERVLVSPKYVKRGEDSLRARMLARVKELRQLAADLEAHAYGSITMPTAEDWEAANARFKQEETKGIEQRIIPPFENDWRG